MINSRWVSYIYRYREGAKCENAGFIKVQQVGCEDKAKARIQIGIKLYKNKICKCTAYLLYHQKKTSYLTDILVQSKERDIINKRIEIPWNNTVGNGRDIGEYDGIAFVCDDGEILAGIWKDFEFAANDINYVNITASREADKNDFDEIIQDDVAATESMDDICDEASDIDSMETNDEASATDICIKMLESHPRLPVFMDSQLIECVKIVPHDIGMLPMANWSLGVNSFLSHGYYHYRYIMMGRVNFEDREIFVIGVPGVFDNKERYLANMFGFSVFIPAKETEILTGKFGYWISEIIRE